LLSKLFDSKFLVNCGGFESPIDGGEGELNNVSANILDEIQQTQDVYQLLAKRRNATGISLLKTDLLQIAKQERDQCKCKDK